MSDDVLLTAPAADEVAVLARGVVSAVAGDGSLSPLQDLLIQAMFHSMTGFDITTSTTQLISPEEFAEALRRRNEIFRVRIVQVMLLAALVARPLPLPAVDRLRAFAIALRVQDEMIDVAAAYATGALELANIDFQRNGYLGSIRPARLAALHTATLDESWQQVSDEPALAGKWRSLEQLPVGSLGRGVADFYRDRGFVYPGLPGSAPPLLAQHDWVHVLAGYGTALENEIEVFGFMARANDDPRAFSLLAMVVSLFETGYLAAGAGLFEANPGHLATKGMTIRLADAMRRAALTRGSHDFLELDWFGLADRPIAVLRAEIGLVPKDRAALAAGTAGPWEPGGITEYQLNASRDLAQRAEREHVPWQPDPSRA